MGTRHEREWHVPDRGMTAHDDAAALYRLMAWLSPSFPVGAFSYSSGIEWAVEAGDITRRRDAAALARADDRATAAASATPCCCAHAHRAAPYSDDAALRRQSPNSPPPSRRRRSAISKPPRRAAPSSTRRARPGRARRSTGWRAIWAGPVAYPVAVGVACAGHGIALDAGAAALSCMRSPPT